MANSAHSRDLVHHESKREGEPISFIWIGSPTIPHTLHAVQGHDVMGPIEIAKKSKNPIFVWCLDDYVAHYTRKLATYGIEIKSIQKYIAAQPDSIRKKELLEIMYVCLYKENRNSVRDRVSFKNGLVYYLLYHFGGYAIDTGALPMKNISSLVFSSQRKFRAIKHVGGYLEQDVLECWLMFSPREHPTAMEISQSFYRLWKEAEKKRSETYLKEHHIRMGEAVITPLMNAYKQGKIDVWDATTLGFFTNVYGLSLVKIYNGTHKFQNISRYDPHQHPVVPRPRTSSSSMLLNALPLAIRAVCNNEPEYLQMILNHTDNPDEPNTLEHKEIPLGSTALQIAAKCNLLACSEALIQAGADLDLKLDEPASDKRSAREILAEAIPPVSHPRRIDMFTGAYEAAAIARDVANLARAAAAERKQLR